MIFGQCYVRGIVRAPEKAMPLFVRALDHGSRNQYDGSTRYFSFMIVQKQCTFRRSHTLNFEFWCVPCLVMCRPVFFHDAGQGQTSTAPSQPWDHKDEQPRFDNHSLPRQPAWLSLSVQCSINYMRWWRTGKPSVPQSLGSQRVGYDLVTEQQQSLAKLW